MNVIPSSLLFRYTLPVFRVDRLPRAQAPLLKLPKECVVQRPGELDGEPQFAEMAVAWNPHGLAVQITVEGKSAAPYSDPESVRNSDALLVWIDTRDTQSQHRGSRFCHLFAALPTGGGDSGKEPHLRQLPIPRAKEDAPEVNPEDLMGETELLKGGYRFSIWLPKEALHGFDPATQNRLGFMAMVLDVDLGTQYLALDADFPIDADPSLWVSLELIDNK
ncbi:MAG TPA: hypothetical protein VNQ76_13995 [Planctomicrobium sp.]|nr:hypothetical protein [Planctomicrobium sp.]